MTTPDHIALGPTVGLDAIRADIECSADDDCYAPMHTFRCGLTPTNALDALNRGVRAALEVVDQVTRAESPAQP